MREPSEITLISENEAGVKVLDTSINPVFQRRFHGHPDVN
jgi:hypothetical protein